MTTAEMLQEMLRIMEYLVSCRRRETLGEAHVEARAYLHDIRELKERVQEAIAAQEVMA